MRVPGNSALQELFEACGAAELVSHGAKYTATALHHGANDWSRALRRAGITRGDRVICALPNGPAFVQLLVASMADGVTFVPVAEQSDIALLLGTLDARIAIAMDSTNAQVAVPARTGGPPSSPLTPRPSRQRTDSVAFLLRSSGTTGTPRWIALAESGVLAVLESHLPLLAIDGGSALCVLPWHHSFGLVLGLLPALLRARRIVTVSSAQRDSASLIALAEEHAVTHMSMVPLVAMRLAESDDGRALLQRLTGGLVGGAPITAALASVLSATRLRVGYGQTEASPGIMLGQPGEFSESLLGRPVGCDVRIDEDGVLAFHGPNVCSGFWQDGQLELRDPSRWQRTEDVVRLDGDVYRFVGRTSLSFKLANGKIVLAPEFEAKVRQQIPRITDIVLTSADGQSLDVMYSTADSLPVDLADIRRALGGVSAYVQSARKVAPEAWVRSAKGEIDRRHLPATP
jgi:long-subunit acyl-CoA synthetase (AMP-forming)